LLGINYHCLLSFAPLAYRLFIFAPVTQVLLVVLKRVLTALLLFLLLFDNAVYYSNPLDPLFTGA
jgi:hypothetical protein